MIVNKYIINSKIGKGQFGQIYKGKYKKTNEDIAIKFELVNSGINLLKHETTILNYLFHKGSRNTPHVYWYGIYKKYYGLIIPYYDCTLDDYLLQNHLSKNDIVKLTSKMITILETIHNMGVIHRDLKPQNFMMKDDEIILIDFGLSTIFVDEELKHIEPKNESTFIIGTPKFISLHIHNGITASRRDDIISLMYLYLFMINGLSLPWENVEDRDDEYSPHHILHFKNQERKRKKEQFQESIYENTIEKKVFDYIYSIEYKEPPLYQWLIETLNSA
jgi:serine/threonine protein kinase